MGEPAGDVAGQLKAFCAEVNADDSNAAANTPAKIRLPNFDVEDTWDVEEPPAKKLRTAEITQDDPRADEWTWGEWQGWDSRKRKRDESLAEKSGPSADSNVPSGFMANAPFKLTKKDKKRAKKSKKNKKRKSTSSSSDDSTVSEPRPAGSVFREAPTKPSDLSPEGLLAWTKIVGKRVRVDKS